MTNIYFSSFGRSGYWKNKLIFYGRKGNRHFKLVAVDVPSRTVSLKGILAEKQLKFQSIPNGFI